MTKTRRRPVLQGRLLYEIMTARDISQSELARAAVLQKSQLSRYFSGTRMLTVPSMARICLYLRIPIGVIFEEITEQQRPAIHRDFEGHLVLM